MQAEPIQCDYSLPIDSAQKALCVASKRLQLESCVSSHGFSRKAQELDDRWIVTVEDLSLNPESRCRTISLDICKNSGRVFSPPSDESCAIK